MIEERSGQQMGGEIDEDAHRHVRDAVRASYEEPQYIRHAASRDRAERIIEPLRTREELIAALEACSNGDCSRAFKKGAVRTRFDA